MTEDEAKAKWCPYMRILPTGLTAELRCDRDPAMAPRCIGSACMSWRWSRAKETRAYLDAVQARMKETNEGFNVATQKVWAEIGSTFEHTEGYCGLAGKPE